jgi:hypothetical protein
MIRVDRLAIIEAGYPQPGVRRRFQAGLGEVAAVPSEDVLFASIYLALCLLLLGSGILVRLGHLRYQLSHYWTSNSTVFRNLPFGQIPAGIAASLLAVVLTTGVGGVPARLILAAAFAVFGVAIAWLVWPPPLVKPDWLRKLELHRTIPESSRVEVVSTLAFGAVFAVGSLAMLLSVMAD